MADGTSRKIFVNLAVSDLDRAKDDVDGHQWEVVWMDPAALQ